MNLLFLLTQERIVILPKRLDKRVKEGERGKDRKKTHNGVWMSFVELILSLSLMFAFRIKRAPLE